MNDLVVYLCPHERFSANVGLQTFLLPSLIGTRYVKKQLHLRNTVCKYIYQGRNILHYTIPHSRDFQFFERFAVALKKKPDSTIILYNV
jgi:hypothetical protein